MTIRYHCLPGAYIQAVSALSGNSPSRTKGWSQAHRELYRGIGIEPTIFPARV